MLALLSPTMRMQHELPELFASGTLSLSRPEFLEESLEIAQALAALDMDELSELLSVKDEALVQYYLYWRDFPKTSQDYSLDIHEIAPAACALQGIAYQYLDAAHFTQDEWLSAQEKLRFVSGAYGILRPCDGVYPYRLEMKHKLKLGSAKNLYAFWGDKLAKFCDKDAQGLIINLMSQEYSKAILPHLKPETRVISCDFRIKNKQGIYKTQSTWAKISRGAMAQMLVRSLIDDPEELKNFNHAGFYFEESLSNLDEWVFLADGPELED